ncbi:DUF3871 family protein [uncultured Sunxiuqinia sp.]|uniref:DUF3871 family protein n=1 Tax=uncultured Sunxiuqinia sp. TaxID=1573825 RepID=UPI002AA90827|nr:DUF3871 family protein [uncultured Sunxiuqinia sp.]
MEILKTHESPVADKAVMLMDEISSDQFIHANTKSVLLDDLKRKCIIPVFAKDNESTISHTEFIDTCYEAVHQYFNGERILQPAVRASHPIKGRIPEAMGKPVKELTEVEKTLYYERMAFLIELPDIKENISGNQLSLTIGGVRAYNHENLYSKKGEEKFKVFIGYRNWVCTNLCISTDGAIREIRARTINELALGIFNLISEFEPSIQLNLLKRMDGFELSESQFAHLLGKARLYQHLPTKQRNQVKPFPLSDTQVGIVAREYYMDENFSRNDNGSIDLWKLYNLFTGANKSSYIDTFLERGANCFSFTGFLCDQLDAGNKSWYLS